MSASRTVKDEPMLPHSPAAEEAVLGSLLIDLDALPRVAAILAGPGDFFRSVNAEIYDAMLELGRSGTPTDFLAVCGILDKREKLTGVGGPSFITSLVNAVPTSMHAEHYARTVRDKAQRRRLIDVTARITRAAYDETNGVDPLAYAHKALLEVDQARTGGLAPVSGAASELYDDVMAWANDPLFFGQVRGLASGIPTFDSLVAGMRQTDEVILAGRPGMGKSALAFEIARQVGRAGKRAAVFSLEMPAKKVVARWASAESQINSRRVERGLLPDRLAGGQYAKHYVTPEELGAYVAAVSSLSEMSQVVIDHTPGLSAPEIRARSLSAAQRMDGIDLIVVDHLRLMLALGGKGENSAMTEGAKSQALKELAKELNCVVIAVAQLNRGVEARQNRRPILSDLRDSGEHEQNADIVIGLYRDSYYLAQSGQLITPGSRQDLSLEIGLLKHREGEAGRTGTVRYERHLNRFTEFDREAKR